jgi:hypothetical protein
MDILNTVIISAVAIIVAPAVIIGLGFATIALVGFIAHLQEKWDGRKRK